MRGHLVRCAIVTGTLTIVSVAAWAQDSQHPQEPTHDMSHMHMADAVWTFMQDGAFSGVFNHQGGPRGGNEVRAVNWWMGMLSHAAGPGRFTMSGMFSIEPATVGKRGYRELFQVGEAIDGQPNVDRQHPHDAFMEVSAAWRVPIADETTLTIVGAPAGEPALGPTAFMHRASAAALLFAPLSHHTFDSTHVSFGVVTASLARGRWSAEASVFNGREPDADRWNFDFGRLDALSGRVWFRPTEDWAIQVSTGHLVNPEQLESGDVQRTTISASWTQSGADSMTAATIGYGRNDKAGQQAAFAEFTRQRGVVTLSSRLEYVQAENDLLTAGVVDASADNRAAHLDGIGALTVGGIRRLTQGRGVEVGLGGNLTLYAVPESLRASHGAHPVSFQLFLQIRPHVDGMGPMWNMRMGG